MKSMLRLATLICLVAVQSSCSAHTYRSPYHEPVVVIRPAPPAPHYEYRSHPPALGSVWIGGYWKRTGGHYQWIPGHWEIPRHRHGHRHHSGR